jgi:hypothetical protein
MHRRPGTHESTPGPRAAWHRARMEVGLGLGLAVEPRQAWQPPPLVSALSGGLRTAQR